MPDAAPAAAQVAEAAPPQVGTEIPSSVTSETPIVAPVTGTDPAQSPDASKTPPSDWDKQISELRKEAAAHRTEKNRLAAELKIHEDAKLSEQERAAKRLEELEARNRELSTAARQARVQVKAIQLGFADPADAGRFLDDSVDDDGLEAALTALLKSKPYLKGTVSPERPTAPSVQPTNPARSAAAPVAFLRSQLNDVEFVNSNRAAIMLAHKEGRIIDG